MKLTLLHDSALATGVFGLALSPDGSRAYAGCADGRVIRIDPVSGEQVALAGAHDSYASGCVLLPDGKSLVTGGYDGQLLWHDLDAGVVTRAVPAHRFWSWDLALSPDGSRVASCTRRWRSSASGRPKSANTLPEPISTVSAVFATGGLALAFMARHPIQGTISTDARPLVSNDSTISS
jgi:WD40 repeat protein